MNRYAPGANYKPGPAFNIQSSSHHITQNAATGHQTKLVYEAIKGINALTDLDAEIDGQKISFLDQLITVYTRLIDEKLRTHVQGLMNIAAFADYMGDFSKSSQLLRNIHKDTPPSGVLMSVTQRVLDGYLLSALRRARYHSYIQVPDYAKKLANHYRSIGFNPFSIDTGWKKARLTFDLFGIDRHRKTM